MISSARCIERSGEVLQSTKRRPLVLAIGIALSGKPVLGLAQAARGTLLRVGVLAPSTQAKDEITLKPFYDQTRALGWFEGQNVASTGSMPMISRAR